MTASAWTDDRIERLKSLWLEGKTADEVARDLANGITRSAVLGKVHRMGLSAGRIARRSATPAKAPASPRLREPRPPGNAPVVAPPEAAPEAGLATLRSVGRCECRWPYGEPEAPDFTLCGRPVSRGAFCAPHAARAYRPSPDTARTLDRLARIH